MFDPEQMIDFMKTTNVWFCKNKANTAQVYSRWKTLRSSGVTYADEPFVQRSKDVSF